MITYNTTYHIEASEADNLIVFLHEAYVPAATSSGELTNPRLSRVLSHQDDASECFSLQFDCESTSVLHKWYNETGTKLNEELLKVFKDKVAGFPTLMEKVW